MDMKKIRRLVYLKFARKIGNAGNPESVPSIISEGTKIKGDMLSNGTIHVDGKLEGDITCDELVIGVKGSINGNVTVNNLHLYGTLTGKASADQLFIAKTAKLMGDASHNSIAIEPGAYIDGHCIRANNSAISADKPDLMLVSSNKAKKA